MILFSLLGAAALGAIAYYLPATASKAYWFISRSSGVIAYVLVTVGVLWGLVQSGSLFRTKVAPVLALGVHSYLNWLGLGFALLHGLVLLGDTYFQFGLPEVFTPFLAPYRPLPVGMGIIGFYLMLLLTLSFYARSRLGQKSFRLLHYASFGAFALVTAHGILAGTDASPLWGLYAASLAAVVLFTVLRVASTQRAKRAKRQALRQAARPTAGRAVDAPLGMRATGVFAETSYAETSYAETSYAETGYAEPWYAEADAYAPGDQRRVTRPAGDVLPPQR